MRPADRSRVFEKFNANPPSAIAVLRQVEASSGVRLSGDYAEFMQQSNGGEGFIGNAYVILWRAEDLIEMNKAYQVAEYAPGLFLFGSDGGGEAFAFDTRAEAKPVVSVPFVGMDLKLAQLMATNFNAFLEGLFAGLTP